MLHWREYTRRRRHARTPERQTQPRAGPGLYKKGETKNMEANLKDKMVSELLEEIRKGAANEVAALQLAKAKVQEIEDLCKQYSSTAENLRAKIKEKAPAIRGGPRARPSPGAGLLQQGREGRPPAVGLPPRQLEPHAPGGKFADPQPPPGVRQFHRSAPVTIQSPS